MVEQGWQVVVIDDDAGIREAVIRLLKAAGIEARGHASAEAFLDSDAPSPPAVLILDIQLPGLSGIDLYRRLSASGSPPHTVFITGQDSPHHREAVRALGLPYLTKPFHGRDLLDAIGRPPLSPEAADPPPHSQTNNQ